MQPQMPDKDLRTLKLFGFSYYKSTILLIFLILLLGCYQSRNKIEGTWTVIKIIDTGKAPIGFEEEGNRQLQFLENGELKLFNDNKRIGLGLYYYKLKRDSLYLTNIEIDTMGKADTLATQTSFVSFKRDTMIIKYESKTYYYRRAETKEYR